MKKTLYLLLCVCLIFSLALSLAACGKAEFTVTFKVGDEVHDEQLVKEGESATAPEEPTKAGYAFDGWFTEDGELWDETDAITENVTLSAKFSKADYTATFKADGKVVATKGFNVDTTSITAPTVPAKVGYTGAWESFSLGTSDITVNAVYTPIEYTATFKNGDDVVGTVKFTVETTALTEPAVPSKTGYDGAWESYTLGAADITVNSVYTPTEYTATFMSGTDVVSTVTFTVETKSITAPTVPVKNGYHGAWESFVLGTEDITVNAVYTLGEYVAIFKDGNTVVATEKFTYDNTDITVPAVPTKPGYESAWQNYTLGASNITINAIHTPIEYTATFKDGDVVVGTVKFTVETEALNAPAVPDKFGYVGSWENYYIGTSDMVINAVYTPGEYTVIFVNNGIEIGRDTYTYADLTVTEPTPPAKTGYDASWEDYELDCTNIIVNAVYRPTEFTATFVDGGNVVEQVSFTVESTEIAAPAVPTKVGYTSAWANYTISAENKTIEAIHTAIKYTATFTADGETVEAIEFTVETAALDEPAVPAKAGYTGEWSAYELTTEDITVTASYSTIDYTATFKIGTETVSTVTFTIETEELTAPAIPERTGYTAAWTAHDVVADNITVEAIYTAIEYTATLMDGADVIGSLKFTIEDAETILPTTPEKGPNTAAELNFYAWYENAEFTGNTVTAIPAASTGDKVFYARFANTYNVTYQNGGCFIENNNPTVVIEGNAITLEAPTLSEGTFLGWYTNTTFTKPITELSATQTEDITLYAKCEYTITYHLDGGTPHASAPQTYFGGKATLLKNPEKEGYTFGGWYTDAEFTKKLTMIAATYSGNQELYAKWTPKSYKITLNNATADGFATSYTVESGEILLPTNPIPDTAHADRGDFFGWYDNAGFQGEPITSIPAGSSGNKTFYARFEKIYTITYKNGGCFIENNNPTIVIQGNAITLEAPTLSEGTFLGWYTNTTFTKPITELSATQTDNITLYAKCEYTITYHLDGGTPHASAPQTYFGGRVTILKNPEKEGYTFGGWYTDAEFTSKKVTTITSAESGNIELYAKWIPVETA